jgi:hypothetical protein
MQFSLSSRCVCSIIVVCVIVCKRKMDNLDKLDNVTEIIWCVGKAEDLPSKAMVTKNEVLSAYFFLRNIKKLPAHKCISSLVDRMHDESLRIGFLTLQKCSIRAKLQRLLVEHDRIKKIVELKVDGN